MFISRHRIFYKYRLINSVRHLPVLHSYLLLTVLLSQSWTEGMALDSLRRSPCSCLSLWLQSTSVKCYVSTVPCLPGSLPPWYANSHHSDDFCFYWRERVRERKRRAVFTSSYRVSAILMLPHALRYKCIPAYALEAWDCTWELFHCLSLYSSPDVAGEQTSQLCLCLRVIRATLDLEDAPD